MGFSNIELGLLTFYGAIYLLAFWTWLSMRSSHSPRHRRTHKAK